MICRTFTVLILALVPGFQTEATNRPVADRRLRNLSHLTSLRASPGPDKQIRLAGGLKRGAQTNSNSPLDHPFVEGNLVEHTKHANEHAYVQEKGSPNFAYLVVLFLVGLYCHYRANRMHSQLSLGLGKTPWDSWYSQFVSMAAMYPTDLALRSHSILKDSGKLIESKVTFQQLLLAVHSYAFLLSKDLKARGWMPGDSSIVGIAMPRSPEYVAMLLACSKLGVKSLLLPLDCPKQRRQLMLSAARPIVVVTLTSTTSGKLQMPIFQAALEGTVPESEMSGSTFSDPNQGGVVLPSSGSTGEPKLIQRSERSFGHRLAWTWKRMPFLRGERSVQKSHISTTHSLYELFEPLLAGACVDILPDVAAIGISDFWRFVALCEVRRLLLVPSLLSATPLNLLPPSLEEVILMGESPPLKICERLLSHLPGVSLISVYGSTEASSSLAVDVGAAIRNHKRHDDGQSLVLPLGTPMTPEVQVHVLDANRQALKRPGSGTLYISGPNLFDSYLGCPELTNEVLSHTGAFGELYSTQDNVQLCDDGSILFLGRTDDQVKVRGTKVHLHELEEVLASTAGVEGACVLFRKSTSQLVAFVSPEGIDIEACKKHVSSHLPTFMVPSIIEALPSLPMTLSGKVDRQTLALRLPDVQTTTSPANGRQDRRAQHPWNRFGLYAGLKRYNTKEERQLQLQLLLLRLKEILTAATGLEVSDSDTLQRLGIDSLRVVSIVEAFQQEIGKPVPSSLLVGNHTVSQLAAKLQDLQLSPDEDNEQEKNERSINFKALSGLLWLAAIFSLGSHIFKFGPDALQPLVSSDPLHHWHRQLFILIAGMDLTMKMELGGFTRGSSQLVSSFLKLLPVHWAVMLLYVPFYYGQGFICSVGQYSMQFLTEFLLLDRWQLHREHEPLSTAGYISAFLLFVLCYDSIQGFIKAFLKRTRSPLGVLLMLIAMCDILLNVGIVTLGALHKTHYIRNSLEVAHYWPPFQLPIFILGMLTAYAVLLLRLEPTHRYVVACSIDALAILVLADATLMNGIIVDQLAAFRPLLVLLTFGVCTTDCYVSRILAHPRFSNWGAYSYTLFIAHCQVIEFMKWLVCWWNSQGDFGHCPPTLDCPYLSSHSWPGMWLFICVTSISTSVILTKLVHDPCQKLLTAQFAETKK
jgi:acyl-coenzyme A synthetase/AMP-(fatty) acid ligase/peptidoglycan/LPS O-acetylase OafA/YrhL/acyl carrier protein